MSGTGLTVGELREAIAHLPDDAPMFVTVAGGWDLPITEAFADKQIVGDSLLPGAQAPWQTALGLELHAEPEWSEDEIESIERSVRQYLETRPTEWDNAVREAFRLARSATATAATA